MLIKPEAIKDPDFKGMESFEKYTLIKSGNLEEHLNKIEEEILKDKPLNVNKCVFYSVPDAKGMGFCRDNGNYVLSDFRHEWI